MMSAIISAETLGDAIDPVSALVDECKIHLEEDGLEIRAVDPANVGMVDMTLSKTGFEAYDADGGVIGVNLDRFEDVLSMAESGDLVHLELDEETRKLEIQIDGLEYTLALIDPKSIRQEPDIPDLDLAGTYVFEAAELSRAVTAADLCSDHIAIEGSADDALVFAAEGDTDDVEVALGKDELLSGDLDDECQSLFSLDYLKDMTKTMASDATVTLQVGSEMPTKMRYYAGDGDVTVQNLLAPRISKD